MENTPDISVSRAQLKTRAKDALRPNFGNKMLLLIIPIILGIGGSFYGNPMRYNEAARGDYHDFFGIGSIIGLIFSIIIGLLVILITVGAIFQYIKIYRSQAENPGFPTIFLPFQDGSWGKIFVLNLVQEILLSLLTITIIGIPFAIYFGLGWSQSNYILYDQLENGEYRGTMNVLKASSSMMKGLRGNYFVWLLSFIPWALLHVITFGLVGFWTLPYLSMSQIAYHEAIKSGQLRPKKAA